jgi:tetratricopeptide (TPR) repeat protein
MALVVGVSMLSHESFARGRGGFGGGGGSRGGGASRGGFSGGGGFSGASRGGGLSGAGASRGGGLSGASASRGGGRNFGSAPSFSGGNRGGGLGGAGGLQTGSRPSIDSRPAAGGRPGVGAPGVGQPGIGVGGRPGIGQPGGGIGGRPGVGNLPGADQRPSIGQRPGISTLPATLPGLDGRLGNRGDLIGNRGDIVNNRGDLTGNRFVYRDPRLNHLNQRLDITNNNINNFDIDRNDFHDWADHHYWCHNGWHHGYWHGHGGLWWNHMWNEHPAAMWFGLTPWGINRAAYTFGYWGYYNPYDVGPVTVGATTINYSEPLVVYDAPESATPPATDAAALPPGATLAGLQALDQARAAFYQGDYVKALQAVNQAIAEMPKDAVVHEFRALVLFALGKYPAAAATLNAVLAVGPGWDWTTLSGLYPSVDVYTKQLRALEAAVRAAPNAADKRFVLAYHYLTASHNDAAASQLREVVKLQPKDAVAAQLLQALGGTADVGGVPAAQSPPSEPPEVPQVPADQLLTAETLAGTWKAAGKAGETFQLDLTKDGSFVWSFTQGGRTQSVRGLYAVNNNVLAMEPDSGGTLVADVSKKGSGFHFSMLGAPEGDPGLDFQK